MVTIEASASAQHYQTEVQSWEVLPHPIDLLFTLDGSESMEEELPSVMAGLRQLFTDLPEDHPDLRMGLVASMSQCFTTRMVTSETTEEVALAALEHMVESAGGPGSDAGLAMARTSLYETCNTTFLREVADLVTVHISDSAEASPLGYHAEISRLGVLKGSLDQLTVHAVVGDHPSGCDEAGPPGDWVEATTETGGQLLSICSVRWPEELARMLTYPSQESRRLYPTPVPGTLQLTVEGQPLEDGWTYDEDAETLTLLPTAGLELGQTVELSYEVMPPASECP